MKLTIITPQSATTRDADKVFLPGAQGSFMVLQGHAPLISTIAKGQVRYEYRGEEQVVEQGGGLVEVNNNVVKIVVEQ
jgi:F-type H+-transporting ATPase subunit epsilon